MHMDILDHVIHLHFRHICQNICNACARCRTLRKGRLTRVHEPKENVKKDRKHLSWGRTDLCKL